MWSGEVVGEITPFLILNIWTLTCHPLLFHHDCQDPDFTPPPTSGGTPRPISSVLPSSLTKLFTTGMGLISRIAKFFDQVETTSI